LRKTMHDPIAKTGAWIKRMLQGHLNYFAVSGNHPSLWWFFNQVRRLWLMSLRRRSQKAQLSWEKFIRLVARFFPPIRTLHPTAMSPFRRQNPREEPGALAAHAGIRAGGGEQSSSLPQQFAKHEWSDCG
jgi:RNA-directed DNA polymerase